MPTICIAGHRHISETQGGVELQTFYIGKALAENGWNVDYLCPSLEGKQGKEKIDDETSIFWFPMSSYYNKRLSSILFNYLSNIQPSVFYQRGVTFFIRSNIISGFAKVNSIPLVFGLSSDTNLNYLCNVKDLLKSSKKKWKKCLLIPLSLWTDLKLYQSIKKADFLITQHEKQQSVLKNKWHLRSTIVRSLHLEVKNKIKKSNKNEILWITNYRKWKQGELFVKLAKRCQNYNVKFIMVYGRTKFEYIKNLCNESHNTKNLTLIGELVPHKIEQLLENAILFVNTSLPMEGFPNTFIQAWLRETPVISLNVDPGDVLKREKIGIHSGNFEELVKNVQYLLGHDQERIAMGRRAREYAEKHHGYENNKQKILNYFNRIVS